MNILIGSNVHWWNAEAAYAAAVAELLHKAGHQVFVLTRPNTANSEQLQKRGLFLLTHINLNTNNPFRLFRSYFQLKRFVREHHIDVINPHRSEGLFLFVFLAWQLKSFVLIATRGTTRPIRNLWLNRLMHKEWIDAHIFAGNIIAERLLQITDLPHNKYRVIYYPIDSLSLTAEAGQNYHQEFSIPVDHQIIAIVGRVKPVKGHAVLLQSLKILLERQMKISLLVLYKHPDPQRPELVSLQHETQRLGLEPYVRFIGPRQDIRSIMAFSHLGIVSSIDSEVICRVAVEFFSVATPVVAFPTGCLPEIIQHGMNGYIAENHSSEALASAIETALKDETALTHMGANARQSVEQRFAPDIFLRETLLFFESHASVLARKIRRTAH